MQKCGNCFHWECTINFFCGCEKSSYFNQKRVVNSHFCAWWKGKPEDRNYNIEAINEALKSLGITFEQLFSLRYGELREIQFELERVRNDLFACPFSDFERLQKKENELEAMEDLLKFGKKKEDSL